MLKNININESITTFITWHINLQTFFFLTLGRTHFTSKVLINIEIFKKISSQSDTILLQTMPIRQTTFCGGLIGHFQVCYKNHYHIPSVFVNMVSSDRDLLSFWHGSITWYITLLFLFPVVLFVPYHESYSVLILITFQVRGGGILIQNMSTNLSCTLSLCDRRIINLLWKLVSVKYTDKVHILNQQNALKNKIKLTVNYSAH